MNETTTADTSQANRIVYDMPMQDYLASPGISKHALEAIAISPAYYRDMMDGNLPTESKAIFDLGSALHSAVLEAKTIHLVKPATYVNKDGETKPWNANSTSCREWLRSNAGRLVLDAEDDQWIRSVQAKVLDDNRCARLMIQGQPELSMFAMDKQFKVNLKCRPDWAWLEEGIFVDVKTMADASTESLSRSIVRYRWHVQAAMMRRVAKLLGRTFNEFYFIAIEKSNPPRLNVRRLDNVAIDRGEELLEQGIKTICECRLTDEWPDYSGPGTDIKTVDIPAWAYNEAESMGLKIGGLVHAL